MTPTRLEREAQSLKGLGFDKGQIRISTREEVRLHPLAALWKDREKVAATLRAVFNTPFFVNPMQVQPPGRDDLDAVFHKDRAMGNKTEAQQTEQNRLIAFVAHKNQGTILLPFADAGKPSVDTPDGRALYYNPGDISRQYQADTHDVVLVYTGENGTVHRAPRITEGDRWLSFIYGHPCTEIKRNLGMIPE
jgi:hypothetical protein